MTGGARFRRRVRAAQSDAELLIGNVRLKPDERMRLERSLNTLRAIQNAVSLLVVPVDAAELLREAEQDLVTIWCRVHDMPPSFMSHI